MTRATTPKQMPIPTPPEPWGDHPRQRVLDAADSFLASDDIHLHNAGVMLRLMAQCLDASQETVTVQAESLVLRKERIRFQEGTIRDLMMSLARVSEQALAGMALLQKFVANSSEREWDTEGSQLCQEAQELLARFG